MAIDYDYWQKLVNHTVSLIANEEHQRREWLENYKNTNFTPVEFFCKFFDDADVGSFLSKNENGLTSEQKELLSLLFTQMELLSDKYPDDFEINPEILVNDPLLIECRETAKAFLT